MQQPQIVEKPAFTVVGLEGPFLHALSPKSTNFKVIPFLWKSFSHRAKQVPHRTGREMVGVIYGRPESERKHPDELRYIAGVCVTSAAEIPEGMVSRTVEAGTYAVFVHRGVIRNIVETVTEIYRVWLPGSDYAHAGIADVEVYDSRFHPDREDSEMEYWISVQRKTASA